MSLNQLMPETTSVIILSAGHGTRMLPLTQNTPKPLLKVGEYSLIEHHLIRLKQLGFINIVINIAYLGKQIRHTLGDGSKYGLSIQYSDEAKTGALETAGGIKAALPMIKSDPFIVINADIWTNYDFSQLLTSFEKQACLVMVKNPSHNSNGDFAISKQGILSSDTQNRYTFSGIGVYRKSMFAQLNGGKQALAPVFRSLIKNGEIQGLVFNGQWQDIGTPERLEKIKNAYQPKPPK